MATIELRLNSKKPGNYAFFCPVTKLHLTIANPVGFADRVSNYILRGIKGKTLIDVNGVVGLETGNVVGVKKEEKKEEVKLPELTPAQEPATQEPEEPSQAPEAAANVEPEAKTEETESETEKVEDTESEESEAEEATEKKKRGRRAQN